MHRLRSQPPLRSVDGRPGVRRRRRLDRRRQVVLRLARLRARLAADALRRVVEQSRAHRQPPRSDAHAPAREPGRSRAPGPGRRVPRTTSTGQGAPRTTLRDVEPNSTRSRAEWPRAPSTISCEPSSRASRRICSWALPALTRSRTASRSRSCLGHGRAQRVTGFLRQRLAEHLGLHHRELHRRARLELGHVLEHVEQRQLGAEGLGQRERARDHFRSPHSRRSAPHSILRNGAPVSGACPTPCRTVSTGHGARRSSSSVTDPSSRRFRRASE